MMLSSVASNSSWKPQTGGNSIKSDEHKQHMARTDNPGLKQGNEPATTNKTGTIYSDPMQLPDDLVAELDVILVLSGGVPSVLDEPPVYVQRRCDDAVEVFRRRQSQLGDAEDEKKASGDDDDNNVGELPILCVGAGTAHLPQPFSRRGLPIWEATASAAYMQRKYGLEDNIYLETTSYDTIGNAFFARTSHTDITGWRRLLVVTSKFHVDRAKAIFDWVFGVDCRGYELHYLASPDIGLEKDALEARVDKEKNSEKRVQHQLAQKHQTLHSVWKFFHDTHGFHNAKMLIERDSDPADETDSILTGSSLASTRKLLMTTAVSSISLDSQTVDENSSESLLMRSYGS